MNQPPIIIYHTVESYVVIIISVLCCFIIPAVIVCCGVIIPKKLSRKCSKKIKGKVVAIYNYGEYWEKRHKKAKRLKAYVITCAFSLKEEKYFADLVSATPFFNTYLGDEVDFYVNPEKPSEYCLKNKSNSLAYAIIVSIAANIMVSTIPMILNTFVIGDNRLVGYEQDYMLTGEVSNKFNYEYEDMDTIIKKIIKVQEAKKKAIAKEKQGKIIAENQPKTSATDRPLKRIWTEEWIKEIDVDGVNITIPKTYELQSEHSTGVTYSDTVSKDSLTIEVYDTSKTFEQHCEELKKDLKRYHKITKIETYTYDGYKVSVMYLDDITDSHSYYVVVKHIYAIAVKNDKYVKIMYNKDKRVEFDIKNMLDTLKF